MLQGQKRAARTGKSGADWLDVQTAELDRRDDGRGRHLAHGGAEVRFEGLLELRVLRKGR